MKAYVIVTGTLFGLMGIGHFLRLFVERRPLDSWFLGINLAVSLVGAGFAIWAIQVLRRTRQLGSDR
jgi:hypothetical protein